MPTCGKPIWAKTMLEVRGLESAYGASQVLFGIDLDVGPGEVATLIGRNGMGKTTTVRTIMGLLPAKGGRVSFGGSAITGLPSYKVAKAGLGLVPEGRQIFPNLSVCENLQERAENMGNQLSGGEQQMLAIGRALMTNPRLLILDEATEGLAPLIRQEIWRCLASLKAEGQSILVIDKNVDALTRIADRHTIIEKGRVVWTGSSAALRADEALQHRYLGV
jgi:branched-chain amino acid transport system ATP-binding protein